MTVPEMPANTHAPIVCEGEPCCVHNPSDHHMRDWPMVWRDNRYLMERTCPHGIGHPDPDHMAYVLQFPGRVGERESGVHGCDGCCTPDREPFGADDDYATEVRQWIDEGYAIPPEVTHRTALPMPADIDDIPFPDACAATAVGVRVGELETRCRCPHTKRAHHGRDHTGPCTHRACGCGSYRDLADWETKQRLMERYDDDRDKWADANNDYGPEEG